MQIPSYFFAESNEMMLYIFEGLKIATQKTDPDQIVTF